MTKKLVLITAIAVAVGGGMVRGAATGAYANCNSSDHGIKAWETECTTPEAARRAMVAHKDAYPSHASTLTTLSCTR